MVVLAGALIFRIAHETDSHGMQRLLILFPIVAVGTVFLARWWNETFRFFVARLLIVVAIGASLLLFI